ncbi:MAG: helix-turn-helix domain-containing protein [Pseudomonadota bacterium]
MFLIRRGMRVKDVAAQLGVGRSTLYRYFAAVRAMNNNEEGDCVVA